MAAVTQPAADTASRPPQQRTVAVQPTFTEPMFVLEGRGRKHPAYPSDYVWQLYLPSSFTVQMKEKARLSQQDAYRPASSWTPARCSRRPPHRGYPDLYRHTAEQAAQKGHYLLLNRMEPAKSPLCFREYSSPATGRGPALTP